MKFAGKHFARSQTIVTHGQTENWFGAAVSYAKERIRVRQRRGETEQNETKRKPETGQAGKIAQQAQDKLESMR